jgi:methionine synthase II (cobalamin-independent)
VSNRESLRDAVTAVLKRQELAAIDVLSDGEFGRWDVNYAETNGMVDYSSAAHRTGFRPALFASNFSTNTWLLVFTAQTRLRFGSYITPML